jgi:hypothetical protein
VAQLWGGVDGGSPVRARSRLAGHGLGAPSERQCWSLLPTLGLADNDESIEVRFGLAGRGHGASSGQRHWRLRAGDSDALHRGVRQEASLMRCWLKTIGRWVLPRPVHPRCYGQLVPLPEAHVASLCRRDRGCGGPGRLPAAIGKG